MPLDFCNGFEATAARSQLQLVWRLAQRQLSMRYKESALGITWSIVAPLFLLGILRHRLRRHLPAPVDRARRFRRPLRALHLLRHHRLHPVRRDRHDRDVAGAGERHPDQAHDGECPVLPTRRPSSSLFTFALSTIPFLAMYAVMIGTPPWTIVLAPRPARAPVDPLYRPVVSRRGGRAYFRDLSRWCPCSRRPCSS